MKHEIKKYEQMLICSFCAEPNELVVNIKTFDKQHWLVCRKCAEEIGKMAGMIKEK